MRHQLARDKPRWALPWAGLPRQLHCGPLIYYNRLRRQRPRLQNSTGAVRAGLQPLRLADRRSAGPRAALPRAVWPAGRNIRHRQHHRHHVPVCRTIRRLASSVMASRWTLAAAACCSNPCLWHVTQILVGPERQSEMALWLVAAKRLRSRRAQMGCCKSNSSSCSSILCKWHMPLALEAYSHNLCLWCVMRALAGPLGASQFWARARRLRS